MNKRISKFLFLGIVTFSVCAISSPKSNAISLAESSNITVYKGDVIQVEDKVLQSSSGEKKVVKGKIITPSGNSFEGDSFSASEFGTYQVIYRTYFGYNEVKEVLTYNCQRRAVDLFETNNNVEISYGQYAYNSTKVSHQGVILDMKAGATINFGSIIDVSRLTADTVLFDYIVEPSTIGKNDFSNFTIRLSDADDSSRYVDIYAFDPGSGVCYDAGTHIRVGYEGSFMGGAEIYSSGIQLNTSTWGTPILSSFHAYPSQEPTHNAKIYFDYENQTTYASPRFTDPYVAADNKTLVNNFKNVKWYKSAVWGGFPSGKVKMSITPGDFNASSGRILIKQILGYDLSKTNFLTDETAPTINIDYENQDPTYLPKAMLNKPYRVFDASAIDDFDKDTKVITNVYYYSNGSYYDVSINDGAFIPTKPGKYVIRYYACDLSGNETEKNLYIFTDTVSDLKISLSKNEINTSVFKDTDLPTTDELFTSGGTGVISYQRILLDTAGNIVSFKGDSFTPESIGQYILRFEAYDFIGNTATFEVKINVSGLDKPVLVNEPLLPPALVHDYTYSFDKYEAYETNGDQIIDLSDNVQLFINGELVTSLYQGDINRSELKEGKYYSTFEYKVTSPSTGKTTSIVKEIQVFDTDGTKDKENYFVGSLVSSTKYVTEVEKEEIHTSIAGVSLLSSDDTDGYSYFARVLDSSYLNMGFMIDEEAQNYERLNIKLIDATDADNTVTFSINPNSNSPVLTFPGYESDFTVSKGMFSIRYVDSTFNIYDTSNKELSSVSVNDNGEEFIGFAEGVYVLISIERNGKTGDAGIIVTNLGNQPFTVSTGIKTADKIAPTIKFDDEIISDQHIGENFIYPHVTAYDVLSEIKSLTGKVYYNNDDTVELVINEDMTNTFTITKYGTYDVEYVATDTKGKSVIYYAHISVKDTSVPEIEIISESISGKTFSVGDVIKLPKYKVSDNLDSYILDMILICPNGERRCLLRDENGDISYYLDDNSRFSSSFIKDNESYIADMSGTFTLRLIAYDDSFNKITKDLTYTVK